MLSKIARTMQQKDQENRDLQRKVDQLEAAVSERQRIADIQAETKFGSEGSTGSRMKRVVQVRKLRDIVNSQEQELAQARAEVAKLRKSSFPFVDAPPSAENMHTGWGASDVKGVLRASAQRRH